MSVWDLGSLAARLNGALRGFAALGVGAAFVAIGCGRSTLPGGSAFEDLPMPSAGGATTGGGAHAGRPNVAGAVGVAGAPGVLVARSISSSGHHVCAVLNDATLRCWGRNDSGQLGDGSAVNRSLPVLVPNLPPVLGVATGLAHTCALVEGWKVQCWGVGPNGQLGSGALATKPVTQPQTVSDLPSPVAISAGRSHSCALLASGEVRCWGDNTWGQLGSDGAFRATPATVKGVTAKLLSVGDEATCAVDEAGSVACWGSNLQGKLAGPIEQGVLFEPSVVELMGDSVTAIGTGAWHSCASLRSGRVSCFGDNFSGELGIGTTTLASGPVEVPELIDVLDLSVGNQFTCARGGVDLSLRCWGNAAQGQLGDGIERFRGLSPSRVLGLSGVQQVVTGLFHACALLASGQVRCWGSGDNGELGNGDTRPQRLPVIVAGF